MGVVMVSVGGGEDCMFGPTIARSEKGSTGRGWRTDGRDAEDGIRDPLSPTRVHAMVGASGLRTRAQSSSSTLGLRTLVRFCSVEKIRLGGIPYRRMA